MCYMLFHQLKLNDDLRTYYGIQDLVGVQWQGDSAAQVATIRDGGGGVTFLEHV